MYQSSYYLSRYVFMCVLLSLIGWCLIISVKYVNIFSFTPYTKSMIERQRQFLQNLPKYERDNTPWKLKGKKPTDILRARLSGLDLIFYVYSFYPRYSENKVHFHLECFLAQFDLKDWILFQVLPLLVLLEWRCQDTAYLEILSTLLPGWSLVANVSFLLF